MARRLAAIRRRGTTVTTHTTAAAGAAIATAGLTKDYSGAVALGPLDLVVSAGQRVSLVGHNGSGKTT